MCCISPTICSSADLRRVVSSWLADRFYRIYGSLSLTQAGAFYCKNPSNIAHGLQAVRASAEGNANITQIQERSLPDLIQTQAFPDVWGELYLETVDKTAKRGIFVVVKKSERNSKLAGCFPASSRSGDKFVSCRICFGTSITAFQLTRE
jgi:hypothetical protein